MSRSRSVEVLMFNEKVWEDVTRQIGSASVGFRIENDGRMVEVAYGGGYRLYNDWDEVGFVRSLLSAVNFLRYGFV